MAKKMKGVITNLKRYTTDGECVGTETIFVPECNWWMKDLGDYLARTTLSDFGDVITEFGTDVAQRVADGEIVEVEREAPDHLEKRDCPAPPGQWTKIAYPAVYPFPAFQEDLVRERPIAKGKKGSGYTVGYGTVGP